MIENLLSELKVIDFTYFYFLSHFYFLLFSISELRARVIYDVTVLLSHISHSHMIMCHNGRV